MRWSIWMLVGVLTVGLSGPASSENEASKHMTFGPFYVHRLQAVRLAVQYPELLVQDFPALVQVRMTNVSKWEKDVIPRSLATTTGLSTGLAFLFLDSDGVACQAEPRDTSRDQNWRAHYAPPDTKIPPEAQLTMWVDIAQLGWRQVEPEPRVSYPSGRWDWPPYVGPFLQVGEWRVLCTHRWRAAVSEEHTVKVRPPGGVEQKVIGLLKRDGVIRSWFPEVILESERIEVPNGLPPETHRVVELIKVVRACRRSPEEGLKAIEASSSEDWRHLAGMIDMLEYECLRQLKREGAASGIRARYEKGGAREVHFDLIDEGRGMLAELARIAAGGSAHRKDRAY